MALSASGWRHNKLLMEEIEPLDPAQASASSAIGRRVLALNNEHAKELSWLDADRLVALAGRAFLARRIGAVDAFLLAFDQDADYDSPNFLWFRSRYPRFVYVDRIVVAPRRADAATPAGCTATFSSTLFAPTTNASSARSTASRPIPRRMPSMRRWASPRSASLPSTAAARPSDIWCESSAKRAPSADRGSPPAAPAPYSVGRAAAARPAPGRTGGSCL